MNCGKAKQQCKLIRSQACQEWQEGSETSPWSPERTVKAHECAASHVDEEIVRYSLEMRRVQDKEPVSQHLDAPFEHNAGEPYEFRDYGAKQGREPWQIMKVAYQVKLETPSEWERNSPYSVQDINRKATPWLQSGKCGVKDEQGNPIQIWAGCTIDEFVKLIERAKGDVYLKFTPSD